MRLLLALAFLAVCVGIVGYLWWTSHPQILDSTHEKRGIWDQHSIGHLLGAMGVALVAALLARDTDVGFMGGVGVWLLVEVAQKWPRRAIHRPGRAEFMDIVWDVMGAWIGALLAALILT